MAIIKIAQRIGIPLATIGDAFGVLPEGTISAQKSGKCCHRSGARSWTGAFHTLTALRDQLDGCIGCGCLSRRDCPPRNPGDKLGKGTGARLLGGVIKLKRHNWALWFVFRSWSFALSRWFTRGFPDVDVPQYCAIC